MSGKLAGKSALITGAGSGIGLATAKRFVSEGAFVFMADRNGPLLEAEAEKIGEQVLAIRADVTLASDLDALFAKIAALGHKLDVVFANAGVGKFSPLGSITEDIFDTTFAINVKGVLFTVQKALPLINDGGSIILTSSITSVKGDPAFSVYSASKAAVRSFARGWTNDLKDRRIRVNAICPGTIQTPAIASLVGGEDALRAFYDNVSATVPAGRPGTPDEIAKAVAFLASDEASYISGIELFVDGGQVQV